MHLRNLCRPVRMKCWISYFGLIKLHISTVDRLTVAVMATMQLAIQCWHRPTVALVAIAFWKQANEKNSFAYNCFAFSAHVRIKKSGKLPSMTSKNPTCVPFNSLTDHLGNWIHRDRANWMCPCYSHGSLLLHICGTYHVCGPHVLVTAGQWSITVDSYFVRLLQIRLLLLACIRPMLFVHSIADWRPYTACFRHTVRTGLHKKSSDMSISRNTTNNRNIFSYDWTFWNLIPFHQATVRDLMVLGLHWSYPCSVQSI